MDEAFPPPVVPSVYPPGTPAPFVGGAVGAGGEVMVMPPGAVISILSILGAPSQVTAVRRMVFNPAFRAEVVVCVDHEVQAPVAGKPGW